MGGHAYPERLRVGGDVGITVVALEVSSGISLGDVPGMEREMGLLN